MNGAFVTRYETQLAAQAATLRAFFARGYGESAESELDRFVTRLANHSSTMSAQHGVGFCAAMSRQLSILLALEPARFPSFVAGEPHAQTHGFEACKG